MMPSDGLLASPPASDGAALRSLFGLAVPETSKPLTFLEGGATRVLAGRGALPARAPGLGDGGIDLDVDVVAESDETKFCSIVGRGGAGNMLVPDAPTNTGDMTVVAPFIGASGLASENQLAYSRICVIKYLHHVDQWRQVPKRCS